VAVRNNGRLVKGSKNKEKKMMERNMGEQVIR
jgi:hypothetical protein